MYSGFFGFICLEFFWLVGRLVGWLDGFFSKSDVFLFSVINLVYSKPLFVFFSFEFDQFG